ncbi:MAG: Holliday junction resolvase RuvX [Alphaproteobacteria bacterium]|nr:Holliday junction resolvase RuvX [Alphaproteobacteria bacterium]
MDIAEFKHCLPEKKAVMGFDYGAKRLGVAVSDLTCTIASSYKIIYRSNKIKDVEEIKKIIRDKEIGGLVFGLPLEMSGKEGQIAAEVRKFAEMVQEETGLPCAFWDERLSSSAAESFLIKEVDMSRSKRRKVLDSSAAAYILQGFLDCMQRV